MAFSIIFVAAAVLVKCVIAKDCQSDNGMPCVKSSELHPYYQGLMKDGDPCFTYAGRSYCFINTQGSLVSCQCSKPECGCGGSAAGPTRDPNTCYSSYGEKCLMYEDLPTWIQAHFEVGNPCRSDGWCFVNTEGSMHQCSCSDAPCGCDQPIDKPTCDNSDIPSNLQETCDSDKWCGENEKHTMCVYCGVDMERCGSVCQRGLTELERQLVLDAHNDLRQRVALGQESKGVGGMAQPSASNMMKLQWDNGLEEVAQRWTDQCIDGHDDIRSTNEFPGHVGQNWATMGFSYIEEENDAHLSSMVQMWYDEVKDMSKDDINPYSSDHATGVVGHYTQVVWAETTHVGCGFNQFKKPGQDTYSKVLICNYGPGGNMIGTSMYEVGEPASACPDGFVNNNGLCA